MFWLQIIVIWKCQCLQRVTFEHVTRLAYYTKFSEKMALERIQLSPSPTLRMAKIILMISTRDETAEAAAGCHNPQKAFLTC